MWYIYIRCYKWLLLCCLIYDIFYVKNKNMKHSYWKAMQNQTIIYRTIMFSAFKIDFCNVYYQCLLFMYKLKNEFAFFYWNPCHYFLKKFQLLRLLFHLKRNNLKSRHRHNFHIQECSLLGILNLNVSKKSQSLTSWKHSSKIDFKILKINNNYYILTRFDNLCLELC